MQYLWNHIETILAQYDGGLPFMHYLKAYYKKFPILGSRDRRAISNAVYAWYRCGKAFANNSISTKKKIGAAMYMLGGVPAPLLDEEVKNWRYSPASPAGATRELRKGGMNVEWGEIFPSAITLSDSLDKGRWVISLLSQPRLFLRTRKPREIISKKLTDANTAFEWLSPTCLALPNGTKVETILAPDDYWIMDASSQKTGDFFQPQKSESWWDCCSGAGGKSLLLKHLEPSVTLTVSDIRESILQNLKARFRQYHLPPPEAIIADASDDKKLSQSLAGRSFDAIICDAPCTGSGTWARTPEGAYFFKEDVLEQYTNRQKAILCNAAKYLKTGGRIIYITCSVFKAENEDVAEYASKKTGLTLQSSQLINGIEQGADCLYAAVLIKG